MAKRKRPDLIDRARIARELKDKEAEASAADGEHRHETEEVLAAAHADLFNVPRASALKQFADQHKDGTTDFWADQANWVRRTGETPLEFLVRSYRNPLIDIGDRINAASKALALVHKHAPQLVAETDADGKPQRVTTARERIMERILGLAREPEAAGQERNSGGKASDRAAKR